MAKTKSFAEKMLKSKKPSQDFDFYKVINAKASAKGGLKYDTKIVKVRKDGDEKEALGL